MIVDPATWILTLYLMCMTSIALAYIWWYDRQEQRMMQRKGEEDDG